MEPGLSVVDCAVWNFTYQLIQNGVSIEVACSLPFVVCTLFMDNPQC